MNIREVHSSISYALPVVAFECIVVLDNNVKKNSKYFMRHVHVEFLLVLNYIVFPVPRWP